MKRDLLTDAKEEKNCRYLIILSVAIQVSTPLSLSLADTCLPARSLVCLSVYPLSLSLSLCFFSFSRLLWRTRFVLSSNSTCIVGESCNGCCLSSTTHHPGFYYHDFRAIVYDGWRRKEEINPTAATMLHSAFFVSSSSVENHFFLRRSLWGDLCRE